MAILEYTLDMGLYKVNRGICLIIRGMGYPVIRNHIIRLWMNNERRFTHPLCNHEYDEDCLLCCSVFALCENHPWWEACQYCRRR